VIVEPGLLGHRKRGGRGIGGGRSFFSFPISLASLMFGGSGGSGAAVAMGRCLEPSRSPFELRWEYGRQLLLRCGSRCFMAVPSGEDVGTVVLLGRLGRVPLGIGGFLEPGMVPSLPDPEAGVLSGGHIGKGGMSTCCVDAPEEEVEEVEGVEGGRVEGGGGDGRGFLRISDRMVSRRILSSRFPRIIRMSASPVLVVRVLRSSRRNVKR